MGVLLLGGSYLGSRRAEFVDGTEGLFVSRPQAVELIDIFADGFESGDISMWSTPP